MQTLNNQQIEPMSARPTDYSGLWERDAYAFDLKHDSAELESVLNLKELVGLTWLISLRNQVVVNRLSLIITIEGRHRSGKSIFGAVDLAMIFDKTYLPAMKTRIVQDANQLLELIKFLRDNRVSNPVIIVDEAGASLSSLDWYERIQKAVIKTMQVIGFLHPIIVFIAPVNDQIASGLRKMSHLFIKVSRKSKKFARIMPYNVSYDSRSRKYYYPRPRIKIFGTTYTVAGIKISMPPKELAQMYQDIEEERKPVMLEDIKEEAQMADIKKQKQIFDYDKTANFVASNLSRYETRRTAKHTLDPNREIKIDWEMVQHDFKCTQSQAKVVKREAEDLLAKKREEVKGAIKSI